MSDHTRTSLLANYVFLNQAQIALIPVAMQPRLWAYVGGIARTKNMKALAVGGMPDHLHVLLSLSPDMTVSKAIQLVKAGSSRRLRILKKQNKSASVL